MAGVTAAGNSELLLVYEVRNYHSEALPNPANTVFALRIRAERR